MISFLAFFFLDLFSQSTYYVISTGTDSSSCGTQNAPCASINQVLTNYPGASFTVSIGAGTYATMAITLQRDAFVILQGTGNTFITTSWNSGSFITNTNTSGVEFHDLSITLSGSGEAFVILNSATNTVGFYNVGITYSGDNTSACVALYGGSAVVSNVTITNSSFNGFFVMCVSAGEASNITITGSKFTNLTVGEEGGLLGFDAFGTANIVINGSTFDSIVTEYGFIGFWAQDSSQIVSITNNVFNNFKTYLPSIYFENDNQCVICVDSCTWCNLTAGFVCSALETLGSDDGNDHNITLSNLKFTNCSGLYAGALLVAFNSLNLSGSIFSANSGQYGNDVVQDLDYLTDKFGFSITNSYSSSALPKAVVWNLSTDDVTDISDQLPNPNAESVSVRPLTLARESVSASPRFGRKPKKN